jgi:hypothetical protein
VEPGGTFGLTHGLGYLFTALRRQWLITDELLLQLTTFLRSLDLLLELIVLTPWPVIWRQPFDNQRAGGITGWWRKASCPDHWRMVSAEAAEWLAPIS